MHTYCRDGTYSFPPVPTQVKASRSLERGGHPVTSQPRYWWLVYCPLGQGGQEMCRWPGGLGQPWLLAQEQHDPRIRLLGQPPGPSQALYGNHWTRGHWALISPWPPFLGCDIATCSLMLGPHAHPAPNSVGRHGSWVARPHFVCRLPPARAFPHAPCSLTLVSEQDTMAPWAPLLSRPASWHGPFSASISSTQPPCHPIPRAHPYLPVPGRCLPFLLTWRWHAHLLGWHLVPGGLAGLDPGGKDTAALNHSLQSIRGLRSSYVGQWPRPFAVPGRGRVFSGLWMAVLREGP